jgi:hypothetical protein
MMPTSFQKLQRALGKTFRILFEPSRVGKSLRSGSLGVHASEMIGAMGDWTNKKPEASGEHFRPILSN